MIKRKKLHENHRRQVYKKVSIFEIDEGSVETAPLNESHRNWAEQSKLIPWTFNIANSAGDQSPTFLKSKYGSSTKSKLNFTLQTLQAPRQE